MKSIDFKVKRHRWIWVLALLFNLFAVRLLADRIYFIFIDRADGNVLDAIKFLSSPQFIIFAVILAADILVLRDASHIGYNLNDKFLTVKFAVFSKCKVIPLITILEVKGFSLMTFQGFGVHIIESDSGAYKIIYRVRQGKRKSIVVSPKDGEMFIEELGLLVDPRVILLNNKESAFTNKKR